ncbi:type IV pili twitching motility protein PilT [Ammoniphilus oxalaticus]|uniref:Type IV pili twitching motility protein PilT n=1 Tax=Ammoniphilus oxalaticus TaxID=66863 RepID=A0A419SIV3_9BACL|nr:type IV pilus twitching motility protein PilT [Ammoniphilus oxalaticus]RKD23886.1 type IV pili twitching motility protein PilT [Ammoniphilus oxalaticus]
MDIIELLKKAKQKGASDLHMTTGAAPVFRLHGQLVPASTTICEGNDTTRAAQQLLTDEQTRQLEANGEIDFSFGLPGISRFRVNIYKQRGSLSLAIRTIPHEIPDMDRLGLPSLVRQICERQQGLFLVTGPTGSGKSTTLAAMVDHINRTYAKHIITLEDPIEYLHRHKTGLVDQREVGSDTASFASGLRSALRQDPDVILVGEMRDLETISTAISAAETGHLVLATLHTTNAPQTIDRIIDAFPTGQQQQVRLQLSSNLLGVLAQRLIPLLDGSGRTAAFEVMVNSTAIANLIRQEKAHQIKSMMETGSQLGMVTMEQSLTRLVNQGMINSAAAYEICPSLLGRFD